MIKRIGLFLIGLCFIASVVMVAIYYINPYGLKTDNIRPRVFGFDIYKIPSKSMQPLLYPGDYITVSNLAYRENSPERGDVIVFNHAEKNGSGSKIQYIKRVIAIAGDTILLKEGELFINNALVKEQYILAKSNTLPYSLHMKPLTISQSHVFVMGDNRDNSADSRMFGSIPITDIIAQASGILYGINNRSGNKIK